MLHGYALKSNTSWEIFSYAADIGIVTPLQNILMVLSLIIYKGVHQFGSNSFIINMPPEYQKEPIDQVVKCKYQIDISAHSPLHKCLLQFTIQNTTGYKTVVCAACFTLLFV